MTTRQRRAFEVADLIPAAFLGSPVGLVLPGLLLHVMPVGYALLIGAIVGLGCGVALVRALKGC